MGFLPYRGHNQKNSANPPQVSYSEFLHVLKVVQELQRDVDMLKRGYMADQSNNYYHKSDFAGDVASTMGRIEPWLSTNFRFAESLTSTGFVRATFGQSLLVGLTATGIGCFATWLGNLPLYAPLVIGGVGFCLGLGVLMIHNRTLLHKIVTQQADKKRVQETKITVEKTGDGHSAFEILYINARIEPEQLREFARRVLDGAPLTVHNWTGRGAVFSRGQYDAVMAEFERFGYVLPAAGNIPRKLTYQGRAVLRGLLK